MPVVDSVQQLTPPASQPQDTATLEPSGLPNSRYMIAARFATDLGAPSRHALTGDIVMYGHAIISFPFPAEGQTISATFSLHATSVTLANAMEELRSPAALNQVLLRMAPAFTLRCTLAS